jgi:hypothetical protein
VRAASTVSANTDSPSPYQVAARLRLAKAVLAKGERVREVTPENTLGRWLTAEDAAALGIAYAGKPDAQILPLDADTACAVAGLTVVAEMLTEHGIRPVLIESGQPGRRHLFARVTDAELRSEALKLARQHGIDPREVIRPPLAPHRLGLQPRLVSPMTVDMAEHVLRRRQRSALSNRMAEILATGVSDHFSDSERLQALANSAFHHGWSFDNAFASVYDSPGGASLRRVEAEGRDPRKYMLISWNKAIEFTLARPAIGAAHDVVELLADMRECVYSSVWPGSTGQTQRAVLLALIAIGLRTTSLVVNASERQLVESSPRATRRPIRNATDALRRDGWITVEPGTTRDGLAATYRLLPARVNKTPLTTSLDEGGVRMSGVFLTHDAFAGSGGLGSSPATVYEALADRPQTTTALATSTGMTTQTTRRALRRLAEWSLAVATEAGWTRGAADLDDVARRRGSAGSSADLRERHELERAYFRGYSITESGSLLFTWWTTGAPTCAARTRVGAPCKARAAAGGTFCAAHRAAPLNASLNPTAADLQAAMAIEQELTAEYDSALHS